MMTTVNDPLRNLGPRVPTPQMAPIPGRTDQVPNSAGGYVFRLAPLDAFKRFVILGTAGGTFYASEFKQTADADALVRAVFADPNVAPDALMWLVEQSVRGLAPRQQPTLYALAVACASPLLDVRARALDAIPTVCRTGTHLFTFATYVQNQRGWGRGLRAAVGRWYQRPADTVAFQAVKYRQREGWTHRDLLRLTHPKPVFPFEGTSHMRLVNDPALAAVYDWICRGIAQIDMPALPAVIDGYERAQAATTVPDVARLIEQHRLPWEAVPDRFLNEPTVWEALLRNGMGITALIRNLARFTRIGLIDPAGWGDNAKVIATALTDGDTLRKGRVHPVQILDALVTYRRGQGFRGQDTWSPVPKIVEALDAAFYLAFETVEPSGKRTYIGLDVSGSMGAPIQNRALTVREAAAAMSMVQVATEPFVYVAGFTSKRPVDRFSGGLRSYRDGTGMEHLPFTKGQRLDDVVSMANRADFGGTDCALPMLDALDRKIEVDTFVIYTDNETWAGSVHPTQALRTYREQMGIDARLVVVGMTATSFTIADPTDPGQLDVVGFDASMPNTIAAFSRGDF